MTPTGAGRSTPLRTGIARLPLPVRLLLAVVLGGLAATGQQPYDLPLVLLIAMALVFAMFRETPYRRTAGLTGLGFGWGYFGVALVWILQPFRIEPEIYGWMAPFALVLLSFGLALFWALAFWTARALGGSAAALVLTWTGVELLRAYAFTGFPWASPPQALVDTMAGQALAWIGPHGLMLGLAAAAAAISAPASKRVVIRAGQLVLVAAVAVVILMVPGAPPPATDGPVVRLVQPNAPQDEKWRSDRVMEFFERQLAYTAEPLDYGGRPDLVVWPETAIPWMLEDAQPAFQHIARAAAGSPVILGLNRRDDLRLYNSLVVLDAAGEVVQTYDKHHIVPFGEYVPFGNVLGRFGIRGMAQREGFGFSSGPGARLLDLGPLGRALPLICYEAVFAQDVNAAPERPDYLVQVTNDAWFGQDVGPQQHLAQARMRAIEQGLPMLRSANTGISAVIDPQGRIMDSLPLGKAGYLDAVLPPPLGATLYSRTGDLPVALVLLAGLLAAVVRHRAGQRKSAGNGD